MSKLYNEYLRLKAISSDDIYLFKSGIFYIALNNDATKLSELFNFKITNLNEKVIKCGFPESRISFYSNLLLAQNISFKIVNLQHSQISNYSDFMKNSECQEIFKKLNEIDLDNLTCLEAFNLLYEISKTVKKIYSMEEN